MAIYIDPPTWPAHGTFFSHLVSDTSYTELHRFAQRLDLPGKAFDEDHYDVPASHYDRALASGALPVSGKDLIRILRGSGLRVMGWERSAHLRQSLTSKWLGLLPGRPDLGERLLRMWSEPHRRYHTLLHLNHCLENAKLVSRSMGLESVPREVLLAIWFHDAVYEGRAGEDELHSATLAREEIGGSLGPEVSRLILLTQSHATENSDATGQILIDADLAILAADSKGYNRYMHQVRDEYAHVPDRDWLSGRRSVLETFLERKCIYQSTWGKREWEARARRNMEHEILKLSS